MECEGLLVNKNEFITLKKLYIQVLFILIIMITSACQKSYNGEYIRWGDSEKTVEKRLEENNIPFKIENGRVYIPEDEFD